MQTDGERDRPLTQTTHEKKTAVVVGSGMAGAAAARTLLDAGWNVRVLEAEAELGGHSRTVGSSLGPIDMGVLYVHPRTYPVFMDLCHRAGVRLAPLNLGIHSVDDTSVLFSSDRPDEAGIPGMDALLDHLESGAAQGTLAQAAMHAGIPMRAQNVGLKPVMGAFLVPQSHPAGLIGDARTMPLLGRSTWYRVRDGFLSLIRRLLDGADVRTRSACSSIRQIGDGEAAIFVVQHNSPTRGFEMCRADAVVLAVDPECAHAIATRSESQRLKMATRRFRRFARDEMTAILHTAGDVVLPAGAKSLQLLRFEDPDASPKLRDGEDGRERYDVVYDFSRGRRGGLSHHSRFGFARGRPILTYVEDGVARPRIPKD